MRKNTEIMKFIKNPSRKMQGRKSGNGCGYGEIVRGSKMRTNPYLPEKLRRN